MSSLPWQAYSRSVLPNFRAESLINISQLFLTNFNTLEIRCQSADFGFHGPENSFSLTKHLERASRSINFAFAFGGKVPSGGRERTMTTMPQNADREGLEEGRSGSGKERQGQPSIPAFVTGSLWGIRDTRGHGQEIQPSQFYLRVRKAWPRQTQGEKKETRYTAESLILAQDER